jgi:hypothetical protein
MASDAEISGADQGGLPLSGVLEERRTGPRDRRCVHTYLAKDRRSGIADRRRLKPTNHFPWHQALKREMGNPS